MALKDWKKSQRRGFYIHIPSQNKEFSQRMFLNIGEIGNDKRNGYYVYIARDRGRKVIQREFKTKSESLAYAKEYMRKH
jgi:hypothetical protein